MARPVRKRRGTSKEFERLAAQLESSLAPTGALVKSPDRIRDKVTGQLREVDASIRYSVGSSDLLITIECRDRVRTQDVTWIEQLATKRFQIGADRTLAVSSTPFTAAALRAARLHGISTRLISEVTTEDIRSQTNTVEVLVESTDLCLDRMQLHYAEQITSSPALDDEAAKAWAVDCWHAPIFRVGESHRPASLESLCDLTATPAITAVSQAATSVLAKSRGLNAMAHHLKDIPLSAPPVARDFSLVFESEQVFALTNAGLMRLQGLTLSITATRSAERVEPSRIGEYSTEERLITRFIEHNIQWEAGKTLSVLSRSVSPEDKLDNGTR
jgi:hypothetical protein